MSYSNPTWYRVNDPYKVQESFEKAFTQTYTTVESYFNEIDKDLKQKETELQEQAKELKKELNTIKSAVPYTKAQIEQQVREFYEANKPSVSREGKNFISRGLNTRVVGSSKAALEEAQANFKVMAGYVNTATEKFLDPEILKNVDKGNPFYLEFAAMREAYRQDPSSIEFKQEDGEFSFNINITDPRTGQPRSIDMEELNMGLSSLSKDVFDTKKKDHKAVKDDVIGSTRTAYNSAYALAKESGDATLILGPELAYEQAENLVKNSVPEETVNSIYNNFASSNIKPARKQEIFSNSVVPNVDNMTGSAIVTAINELPPLERAKATEALAKITDMPTTDTKFIEQLIDDGQIPLAKNDKEAFLDLVDQFRDNVVIAHLADDAITRGVNSRAVGAKKQTRTSNRVSAPRGSKTTTSKEKVNQEQSEYAGSIARGAFSTSGVVSGSSFTSGKIQIGGMGDSKQVVNTERKGNQIVIRYEAGGKDRKTGVPYTKTVAYDLGNVQDVRKMWAATTRDSKFKYFEREMLKQFEGEDGLKSISPYGMQQWIDWLSSRGREEEMIQYVGANFERLIDPSIYNSTWFKFYTKNKNKIDPIARMNQRQRAQSMSPVQSGIKPGMTLGNITNFNNN